MNPQMLMQFKQFMNNPQAMMSRNRRNRSNQCSNDRAHGLRIETNKRQKKGVKNGTYR